MPGRPWAQLDAAAPSSSIAGLICQAILGQGLTKAQVAAGAGIAPATVTRATSGKDVPSLMVVTKIAQVCGQPSCPSSWLAALDQAVQARDAAQAAARAVAAPAAARGLASPAVSPAGITSPLELRKAFQRVRIQAGNPTYRELAEACGLARATVHALMKPGNSRLPAKFGTTAKVLTSLGVSDDQLDQWHVAWAELKFREILHQQDQLQDYLQLPQAS